MPKSSIWFFFFLQKRDNIINTSVSDKKSLCLSNRFYKSHILYLFLLLEKKNGEHVFVDNQIYQ